MALELVERISSDISRLCSFIWYKNTPERRYNSFHQGIPDVDGWEREKLARWMQFLSEEDGLNITAIENAVQEIYQQNTWYTVSLVAHGSSTYGKKGYRDIDLILDPSSGEREIYDKLFGSLGKDFEVRPGFQAWHLKGEPTFEWHVYNLIPLKNKGKPIQLSARLNIFAEEYASPQSGEEFVQKLRAIKKPYVGLIIDNKKVGE